MRGFALGGGCELALLCDIVVAGDDATFGQPEIKLGVMPGAGGTQRLTRAIGKARAMELILTGRSIDAREAERLGLVSRVVPAEETLDRALELAGRIAALPPIAVRAAKAAVNAAQELPLSDGLAREQAGVLRAVRDRRPEGGHGRVRREAVAPMDRALGGMGMTDDFDEGRRGERAGRLGLRQRRRPRARRRAGAGLPGRAARHPRSDRRHGARSAVTSAPRRPAAGPRR